jgi:hypothetical protein
MKVKTVSVAFHLKRKPDLKYFEIDQLILRKNQ